MKKLIVIIIIVIYGCNSKNSEDSIPMNHNFVNKYDDTLLISKLSNRVILHGDTLAYKELEAIFMISEHSDEFLYFSTIMAEKYRYMPAYQTNYYILKNNNSIALRKLAFYNLLKSYELGNNKEIKILNEKFSHEIPNSEIFLNQP